MPLFLCYSVKANRLARCRPPHSPCLLQLPAELDCKSCSVKTDLSPCDISETLSYWVSPWLFIYFIVFFFQTIFSEKQEQNQQFAPHVRQDHLHRKSPYQWKSPGYGFHPNQNHINSQLAGTDISEKDHYMSNTRTETINENCNNRAADPTENVSIKSVYRIQRRHRHMDRSGFH